MSVLVDTNVLLRSIYPSDANHDLAVKAITALIATGEALIITPQVVAEFWNCATRPREKNGFGLTIEQAQVELGQIEGFFTIVGETPDVCDTWKQLVVLHRVSGVQVHDARLVAAMQTYGVGRILTFNVGDFTRYKDIEVIHPQTV